MAIGDPRAIQLFDYLAIYAFVGSLIANTAPLLRLYLYHAVWMLAMPFLMPTVQVIDIVRGPLLFNAVIHIMAFVTSSIYHRQQEKQRNALERSEERYRGLVEHMEDSLFSITPGGIVTDMAGGFVKLTEKGAAGLRGSTLLDLISPQDVPTMQQALQQVSLGNSINHVEVRLKLPKEQYRYVEFNFSPTLQAGAVVGAITVARDIHQRKQVEAELQRERIFYRSLFEQSTDAIFLLDLEGRHVAVNQRAAAMMDYTVEELLQQRHTDTVVPREQSLSQSQRQKLLNGGISEPYERTFRRRNGEEFVAEVTLSLIRDVDGTPIYMHSILRDLTERKRSEAARVKLLILQERAATLGQFFSAISHDFRTNLAQIEMSSFLTGRAIAHQQLENASSKLTTIRSSIAHMTEQLQNLQIVASLNTLHTEPCDLNLLAQSVVAELAVEAAAKPVALFCELDADMQLVPAAEDKLRSVLQHLLRNAVTYTQPQGEVCVRTRQLESGAQIIVSDTGIGIAPEHQAKVFDLFYRADESRTIDTGGFGLGLSIVKLIIEAHGGFLHLQSQPASGTTITITLPFI
ncbi:MAG: PAS domain S-box protein [Chloroflexota bacterium]|nr:PAS domain S-box protein [Chloroflexota bacterium]